MNACPDCGSELTGSAAYCPECGFSVGGVAVTAASAKDDETASGSNLRILVLIGGFVALCVIGFLVAQYGAPLFRGAGSGVAASGQVGSDTAEYLQLAVDVLNERVSPSAAQTVFAQRGEPSSIVVAHDASNPEMVVVTTTWLEPSPVVYQVSLNPLSPDSALVPMQVGISSETAFSLAFSGNATMGSDGRISLTDSSANPTIDSRGNVTPSPSADAGVSGSAGAEPSPPPEPDGLDVSMDEDSSEADKGLYEGQKMYLVVFGYAPEGSIYDDLYKPKFDEADDPVAGFIDFDEASHYKGLKAGSWAVFVACENESVANYVADYVVSASTARPDVVPVVKQCSDAINLAHAR